MVIPSALTNVLATFQRELNRLLRWLLVLKVVIDTILVIDDDGGMVVVAYIDDVHVAIK
jgi:hypothetical protein